MPRWPEENRKPCGSKAAYQRHLRAGQRGEEIDFACRLANSAASNKRRTEADRIYAAAIYRARKELSEMHPEDFKALMAKHTRQLRKDQSATED